VKRKADGEQQEHPDSVPQTYQVIKHAADAGSCVADAAERGRNIGAAGLPRATNRIPPWPNLAESAMPSRPRRKA
jgi:hypothetical protein